MVSVEKPKSKLKYGTFLEKLKKIILILSKMLAQEKLSTKKVMFGLLFCQFVP